MPLWSSSNTVNKFEKIIVSKFYDKLRLSFQILAIKNYREWEIWWKLTNYTSNAVKNIKSNCIRIVSKILKILLQTLPN